MSRTHRFSDDDSMIHMNQVLKARRPWKCPCTYTHDIVLHSFNCLLVTASPVHLGCLETGC
ncbi:hypothetical protein C8R48DRAFT_713244 [Suillus tomentosus]|nr:hypothetical protein C8R48DRAFT_713244 [Suillus tomentosus]